MGTSDSFDGSTNILVPTWADEPPTEPVATPNDTPQPDGEEDDSQDGPPIDPSNPARSPYPPIPPAPTDANLQGARASFTRGARTSDERAITRGAGRYVGATGGGRRAARRMATSRAVAGGLAGLAGTFASQGAAEALRRFDLEGLAGAPATEVFVALTEVLCPPGGTIDEGIARNAMLETITALAEEGVGNFDELSPEQLQEFFIGVVSRSIEGRILNDVGTNSIKVPDDVAAVEEAQGILHDFVEGCVRDELEALDTSLGDLDSRQVDEFVSDLYANAFDLMQVLGEEA